MVKANLTVLDRGAWTIKIQYLSDTHEEVRRCQTPPVTGDILVLGGDIGTGMDIVYLSEFLHKRYKAVIVVNGNHDFYTHDIELLVALQKERVRDTNIHILDNDTITIEGINFIGSTMWTAPVRNTHLAASLADYQLIKGHTIESVSGRHYASVDFIQKELVRLADEINIVITHYYPFAESIHERYRGGDIGDFYCAFLLPCNFPNVTHWIHGHAHDSVEKVIGGIPTHCNPRGRPQDNNEEFDLGEYFEIH